MICPKCGVDDEHFVLDSRSHRLYIRRRRECSACGCRFTTAEFAIVDVPNALEELKRGYRQTLKLKKA